METAGSIASKHDGARSAGHGTNRTPRERGASAQPRVDVESGTDFVGRELTGAEMVIRTLEALGVERVFGYPGGQIMPVYDALLDAVSLRHVLSRHEQGAAHMADGYARASGRVGVCFATSGPGATNLITGLATAALDSSPIVAITGQVPSHLIGTDAFQEADIFGMSFSVTKHSYLVRRVDEISSTIREAFHIARTGRPGPVLIDIPKDVQLAKARFESPPAVSIPGYELPGAVDSATLEAIVAAIERARRPVLYVGGGAISSGAHEALARLVAKTGIPVALTLMGLGAFPHGHERCLGMLGMHGAIYTNRAIDECDLLIAAGARFDDRVTGRLDHFARRAKVVHIDADPAEHSKIVRSDIVAHGDLRIVLEQICTRLEERGSRIDIAAWQDTITAWKKTHPLPMRRERGERGSLSPRYILERLAALAGSDAIVTTDVGQHQMWTAQYYPVSRPRSFITSGGLGTMGFGFPAAIGAKFAHPDRPVICVSGDGSIQMNIQELTTAVAHRLGIVVAIFDNQALGMVRQWQNLFHGKRFSSVDLHDNPDFVRVAQAFGGAGRDVIDPEDVTPAIEEAIGRDLPTFLRFRIHHDEGVFPIIPAGRGVSDAITGLDEA